jgi:hypothetical protein
MKMEAVYTSETLWPIYKTTHCHNLEVRNVNIHLLESVKSICLLKMEAVCTSEALLSTYQITRRHIQNLRS